MARVRYLLKRQGLWARDAFHRFDTAQKGGLNVHDLHAPQGGELHPMSMQGPANPHHLTQLKFMAFFFLRFTVSSVLHHAHERTHTCAHACMHARSHARAHTHIYMHTQALRYCTHLCTNPQGHFFSPTPGLNSIQPPPLPFGGRSPPLALALPPG